MSQRGVEQEIEEALQYRSVVVLGVGSELLDGDQVGDEMGLLCGEGQF